MSTDEPSLELVFRCLQHDPKCVGEGVVACDSFPLNTRSRGRLTLERNADPSGEVLAEALRFNFLETNASALHSAEASPAENPCDARDSCAFQGGLENREASALSRKASSVQPVRGKEEEGHVTLLEKESREATPEFSTAQTAPRERSVEERGFGSRQSSDLLDLNGSEGEGETAAKAGSSASRPRREPPEGLAAASRSFAEEAKNLDLLTPVEASESRPPCCSADSLSGEGPSCQGLAPDSEETSKASKLGDRQEAAFPVEGVDLEKTQRLSAAVHQDADSKSAGRETPLSAEGLWREASPFTASVHAKIPLVGQAAKSLALEKKRERALRGPQQESRLEAKSFQSVSEAAVQVDLAVPDFPGIVHQPRSGVSASSCTFSKNYKAFPPANTNQPPAFEFPPSRSCFLASEATASGGRRPLRVLPVGGFSSLTKKLAVFKRSEDDTEQSGAGPFEDSQAKAFPEANGDSAVSSLSRELSPSRVHSKTDAAPGTFPRTSLASRSPHKFSGWIGASALQKTPSAAEGLREGPCVEASKEESTSFFPWPKTDGSQSAPSSEWSDAGAAAGGVSWQPRPLLQKGTATPHGKEASFGQSPKGPDPHQVLPPPPASSTSVASSSRPFQTPPVSAVSNWGGGRQTALSEAGFEKAASKTDRLKAFFAKPLRRLRVGASTADCAEKTPSQDRDSEKPAKQLARPPSSALQELPFEESEGRLSSVDASSRMLCGDFPETDGSFPRQVEKSRERKKAQGLSSGAFSFKSAGTFKETRAKVFSSEGLSFPGVDGEPRGLSPSEGFSFEASRKPCWDIPLSSFSTPFASGISGCRRGDLSEEDENEKGEGTPVSCVRGRESLGLSSSPQKGQFSSVLAGLARKERGSFSSTSRDGFSEAGGESSWRSLEEARRPSAEAPRGAWQRKLSEEESPGFLPRKQLSATLKPGSPPWIKNSSMEEQDPLSPPPQGPLDASLWLSEFCSENQTSPYAAETPSTGGAARKSTRRRQRRGEGRSVSWLKQRERFESLSFNEGNRQAPSPLLEMPQPSPCIEHQRKGNGGSVNCRIDEAPPGRADRRHRRKTSLSEESAVLLLERSLSKTPDGPTKQTSPTPSPWILQSPPCLQEGSASAGRETPSCRQAASSPCPREDAPTEAALLAQRLLESFSLENGENNPHFQQPLASAGEAEAREVRRVEGSCSFLSNQEPPFFALGRPTTTMPAQTARPAAALYEDSQVWSVPSDQHVSPPGLASAFSQNSFSAQPPLGPWAVAVSPYFPSPGLGGPVAFQQGGGEGRFEAFSFSGENSLCLPTTAAGSQQAQSGVCWRGDRLPTASLQAPVSRGLFAKATAQLSPPQLLTPPPIKNNSNSCSPSKNPFLQQPQPLGGSVVASGSLTTGGVSPTGLWATPAQGDPPSSKKNEAGLSGCLRGSAQRELSVPAVKAVGAQGAAGSVDLGEGKKASKNPFSPSQQQRRSEASLSGSPSPAPKRAQAREGF